MENYENTPNENLAAEYTEQHRGNIFNESTPGEKLVSQDTEDKIIQHFFLSGQLYYFLCKKKLSLRFSVRMFL